LGFAVIGGGLLLASLKDDEDETEEDSPEPTGAESDNEEPDAREAEALPVRERY
jgi:hypothetical protein